MGPSDVPAQSNSRHSFAISPGPGKRVSAACPVRVIRVRKSGAEASWSTGCHRRARVGKMSPHPRKGKGRIPLEHGDGHPAVRLVGRRREHPLDHTGRAVDPCLHQRRARPPDDVGHEKAHQPARGLRPVQRRQPRPVEPVCVRRDEAVDARARSCDAWTVHPSGDRPFRTSPFRTSRVTICDAAPFVTPITAARRFRFIPGSVPIAWIVRSSPRCSTAPVPKSAGLESTAIIASMRSPRSTTRRSAACLPLSCCPRLAPAPRRTAG